ncbi:type I polyketide synthase [Actinocrinis sp.]|uniref:type I polyketide synthase n=1 Tax=Actinocrinis sp. TaxID=1920516 RepID=UPI002CA0F543|nr:type I polyketide synthase [Actinocrinis sp.]HXR71973.1 type I polyketide synthase [Actinocrinis sp.]
MGASDPAGSVRRLVTDRLREWHGVDPAQVAPDRPLAELGLTSRDAVALAAEISELTGCSLPATLLWEAPTLDSLARVVAEATVSSRSNSSARAARSLRSTQTATAAAHDASDIAVVGIGCRLPGGVRSPEQFWQMLIDGVDAVSTLPDGRWEGFAAHDDPALSQVSRHGGYLDDVAGFDASFFGIAPSEAAAMDPQQRLLLEVARESLDHAAIPATALAGSRTGVFVGISGNEYARLTTTDLDRVEAWSASGAALSIAANRLSYVLDLRGPSLAVDTACSSSLVAVHHAVRSLRSGECDTALAGGVNVLLSPALTLSFQRAGALAPDGRCKTFAAAADGMVRAEGCAVVVLRRLADAEAAGDRVLAVIRASAVNSDGRSNGLLAPNAEAQRALLAEVYGRRRDDVSAAEVDYVEAHGTGTALGDPVEASALGAVLGPSRSLDQPLLIGSVKTNLGHLEAAAGIAGLVKTVLALHHGALPPHLHFAAPSPHIDFDAQRLRVVTETEPWPRYSGTGTAGVSAFGFGGTNAHVLLQEYRPKHSVRRRSARGARSDANPVAVTANSTAPCVLALDAPTPDRLREDAADFAAWLQSARGQAAALPDIGYTLAGRLGKGRHRVAVVARSGEETVRALTKFAENQPHPSLATGSAGASRTGAVWVFSGYGSQWPGMAHRLLESEPAFSAAVERLEPLLRSHAGLSLRSHLQPGADLSRTAVAQPVLFGVQIALAELWRAHGSQPAAVIGHSMGEVAAAVVAGALDLEDGARIMAARSRLLERLSGGAMAVVDRSSQEIEQLAEMLPSLRVAVHSSPRQCVVAGAAAEVERLVQLVSEDGGTARPLHVTAAGHTPQVEPLVGPFLSEIGAIGSREPSFPLYTTVDHDPRGGVVLDSAYWARNLRQPVRFEQAVTAAAEDGHRTFVEVSPHPTQLYPINETLRASGIDDALLVPTLRRDTDDTTTFRIAIATMLANGALDPVTARRTLHPGARVIDLPSPRWRHQRFWATAPLPTWTPARAIHRTASETAGCETAKSETAESEAAAEQRPATTVGRLRECVGQVMGYAPESIDANAPLTDLGLDSLQAARILGRMKSEFGVEIVAGDLLNQGTIARIGALLEAQVTSPSTGPSVAAPAPGHARGVLPRDAAERLVTQAWQSVSGDLSTGVCDKLEMLADRPELAAALVHTLGEQLERPVPALATPTAGNTLADVANHVRPLLEEPVNGPVRVLQQRGTQSPLFLIHPAGGSSAVYRSLVQRLGTDRPVYGLERLTDAPEVRDQAAEYARVIRSLHPSGPWIVGGWSFGGLVGQEAARLLAAHGTVSSLILIDTVLPLPRPDLTREQEARGRFAAFAKYVEQVYGAPLPLPYNELAVLDDAMQIELVIKTLQQVVDLPPAIVEHQRDSYLDLRSGERHQPRRYPCRTLLYRATELAPHTVRDQRYERDDERLGWEEFCPDLTVKRVPGHHLCLLDPPSVDVLGALLSADLRAGEQVAGEGAHA